MVRIPQLIKALALFLAIASPAAAEPQLPLDLDGHYDFTVANLSFGSLDIKLKQTETSYDSISDIRTVGIAKVFVKHESHTTSSGTGSQYRYPNVEYQSNYSTNNKKRTARFTKRNGTIVEDTVDPPDNRETRPAVPLEQKSAAMDPLSIALGIRVELARILKSGGQNFSLDYYDGRRLTRGNFTYVGEKTIVLGKAEYPVYAVQATRKAIAGFTTKELKRMEKREPVLTIYFTKEKLVPIRLEVPMMFGLAAATLRM